MATSVGYAPELRAKLLADLSRRVDERLENSERENSVLWVPQSKQCIENLQGDRLRLVPSEESILNTFDDERVAGQLLILGASGSGKTTTLLKLAKGLLGRAEIAGLEIPYIFELSRWRNSRRDLASWLIAVLDFEYGIGKDASREWISNGQLLLLLDGLDELAPDRRQVCIEKINEFVAEQSGRKVAVCCRKSVYEANEKKLDALNGVLRIQPLETDQIRDYLEQVNPEIWRALQDEDRLGLLLKPTEEKEPALLQIPLFLQMLAIAYQPDKRIFSKSELLDAYIDYQLSLNVREADRHLAQSKEIEIEWAYETVDQEPSIEVTSRYLSWLADGLNEQSMPNIFLIERLQAKWLRSSVQKWQYRLIVVLIAGSIGSLLSGLFFGVQWGLIIGLDKISPVKFLKFSFSRITRRELWFNILLWLLFCLVVGLGLGFALSPMYDLAVCLTNGMVYGLAAGLISGLLIGFLESFQTRDTPNQGISDAAKKIPITVAWASSVGLALLLLLRHINGWEWLTIQACLLYSLKFSAFMGFYSGGLAVVQHATLRFLLHRAGHIPRNYAKFLKYTTERGLTQQIGGSFRFIHRELLDHFAAMYDSTRESTSSKSV